MEKPDRLEDWVNQRMAASAPATGWPDPAAGWRRLDQRVARQPHRLWLWAGAAAAAACVAVFALPGPRVVAQRLWDQVVLGRIQVLITDYEEHGAAASFFSPVTQLHPEAHPAASLAEASDRAGFSPRLPGLDVFSVSPTFSVTDAASARLPPLRTPAIRHLMARAGGSASEVPDSWNGVVLEVRLGPVIIADYGGILLLQSLPFELIKPADFDLELLYRVAFQSHGMSEWEARALSVDLAVSPALLMFMPKEDRELVHEFETKSGRGMMVEEVYGPGKIAALWSGSDRVYALFPATGEVTKEFIVKVANAVE